MSRYLGKKFRKRMKRVELARQALVLEAISDVELTKQQSYSIRAISRHIQPRLIPLSQPTASAATREYYRRLVLEGWDRV